MAFHQSRQNPGLWWPPSSSTDNTIPKNSGDGEQMIFKTPESHGHSCQCGLWCPLPLHGVSLPSLYWSCRLLWGGSAGWDQDEAMPYDRRLPGHGCICYRLAFSISTSFLATSLSESDTCSWVAPSKIVLCCWKDTSTRVSEGYRSQWYQVKATCESLNS